MFLLYPDFCLLLQIEGQQMERNQNQQEKAALAKLERIKLDQGKRAEDLERDAAEAESKVSAHALPLPLPIASGRQHRLEGSC